MKKPRLPITKPGIVSGIDIADYHSGGICDGPSVSSTGLRLLWRTQSPAHFWTAWRCNPKAVREPPSEAMVLGSAAHHLLLGEADFSTKFIARPDALKDEDGDLLPWHGLRKVCKAWLRDQERAGRTVLTMLQLEAIRGMARSLAKDPLVKAGALSGQIELSMFAKHPKTGIWLCARPDAKPVSDGDFCDLKSTEDITDAGIFRMLRNSGVQIQGALTWMICDLLNEPFTSFNLIFAETKEPFCVRVVPLTDDDLSLGRRQIEWGLDTIAKCIKENRWIGPGANDPRAIGMPVAERDYINNKLTAMGF